MREWVKVWRPRTGSAFEARVSGPARILFRGLLAYLNEDGVLYLPKSKHAHGALGMAIGYSKDERRALKRQLAELEAHGCLEVSQDEGGFWTISATGWDRYQAPKKGEKSAPMKAPPTVRSEAQKSTTGADRVHTGCTTGADRVQTDRPKPAKSHDPLSQEKRREEERENARAKVAFRDPLGERDRVTPGAFATRLYIRAMRELSDPTWDELRLTGRDRERLSEMTAWARNVADAHQRQGGDWQSVYAQALAGSLDVWREEAKARPGSVPLSPGGWWARRESWRQAA